MTSLLADHEFTKDFWPEHVALLAGMAAEVHFAGGETIFEDHDDSSLFYLLLEGRVALEVPTPGRPVRIATLFAGDVLGWSSILPEGGKQFAARALEPVRALAFDGARLRHACEQDYAFGFRFIRAVAKILGARLRAVRAQLVEAYSPVSA